MLHRRIQRGLAGGNGGDRGTPVPATGSSTGDGYGLTGMRERAELLGGELLAAPVERGFRVELWLPR